jgi:hypothetical protein
LRRVHAQSEQHNTEETQSAAAIPQNRPDFAANLDLNRRQQVYCPSVSSLYSFELTAPSSIGHGIPEAGVYRDSRKFDVQNNTLIIAELLNHLCPIVIFDRRKSR